MFYGLREACDIAEDMKKLGLTRGIAGKTMVVQGLGNVGAHSARIAQDEGGAILVGVSEVEGAIYKADGIDVHELLKFRKETGSIQGFPGAQFFDKKDRRSVLEFECDILIPAALESQITGENAGRIKAKIIAEAANGPTTFEAEAILNKAGKLVIPDVYLNAGGVTVSYFEWLKNLSHMRFGRMDKRFNQQNYNNLVDLVAQYTGREISEEQRRLIARGAEEVDLVRSGLEETMVSSYLQIREVKMQKKEIEDLRTAAFVSAISKISNDYQNMGIFP